jgi:hypothetical protein
MTELILTSVQYCVIAAISIWLLSKIIQRLQLSLAKNPSLGGHLRWAKRITKWIPGYSYNDQDWYRIDHAPEHIEQTRRAALLQLGEDLHRHYPKTLELSQQSDSVAAQGRGNINTQRLSTTLSGRLGEWIEVGGTGRQASGYQSGTLSLSTSDVRENRSIWLMVEEVE